jgi:hypothetical protein
MVQCYIYELSRDRVNNYSSEGMIFSTDTPAPNGRNVFVAINVGLGNFLWRRHCPDGSFGESQHISPFVQRSYLTSVNLKHLSAGTKPRFTGLIYNFRVFSIIPFSPIQTATVHESLRALTLKTAQTNKTHDCLYHSSTVELQFKF